MRVRSWPARPTNGSPCLSSSSPGPSPTTMRRARACPEPKATFVRLLQSLQSWQPWRARSCSRRASAGSGKGTEARLRSRSPRSRWWRRVSASPRRVRATVSRGSLIRLARGAVAGTGARRRAQAEHPVEDGVRHLELAHPGQIGDATPAIEQGHLVVVRLEADALHAHVVGDEEVDALGLEL